MTRLEREIAALADGTAEAPGLRERIASSPELQATLAEQQRAVEAIRAVAPSAPPRLRAAVAGARPAATSPRGRRRGPLLGFASAAAAGLAVAAVAVLPGTSAPSVTGVAALAASGPTAPAPPPDPGNPGTVALAADGVRYPDWSVAFGWHASGTQLSRAGGRATVTVYYTSPAKQTVDYTIVGGAPLAEPTGPATVHASDGVRFLGLSAGGRAIVTWRRGGHTCIVAASGVPLATLLRLAEWHYETSP